MKYANPQTGFEVNLDSLNDAEKKFFRVALKLFCRNERWLAFDEFILSMNSPLFAKDRSHKGLVDHPLFLVLRDMSLQLGVQQGMIASGRVKAASPSNGAATECREGDEEKAPAGRRRAGRSGRR
jgi:hypothetical protein